MSQLRTQFSTQVRTRLRTLLPSRSFISGLSGLFLSGSLVVAVWGMGSTLPFASAQTPTNPQPNAQSRSQGNSSGNTSTNRSVTLLADVQEANAKTGILTATGNVQIFYPSKGITATALQAQYFSRERRMVLTGNVVVNQVGGNTIRGEKVTYLVDEDRFIVVPKGHEQVRSVYVIPEEQSQESPGLPNLPPSPTPKPSTSLMDQLPQSP